MWATPVNEITFPNGDQVYLVSTTFECRVVGGSLCPDGEESLESAYCSPEELPETLVNAHRIRIKDAAQGREAAFFR